MARGAGEGDWESLFQAGACGVRFSAIGANVSELAEPGVVQIGVDRHGDLPAQGLEPFDILLTTTADAPRPWVSVGPTELETTIENLQAQVFAQPAAAATAAQVLRIGRGLPFRDALIVESLAYSSLLASGAFRCWRTETPRRARNHATSSPLISNREGDVVRIQLNRPEVRNAIDARMRDALVDSLETALLDGSRIELSGAGAAFCAGGDLDEFGTAHDVSSAHLIRILRSPAALLHDLGARARVFVHGACYGAGLEIPAAAARVAARRDTSFCLPELSMGLIPGAGGTVSVSRRIGRERTCWMVISGAEVDVETGLRWGLVDEVAQ